MSLLQSLFGPPLPSVNAAELSEKMKNGKKPLVVDVRQPEEYRRGHIKGSKLIPLGELIGRMNELPKEKEIIFVCATGNRSRSAASLLAGAGFEGVLNMEGGIQSFDDIVALNLGVHKVL